MIALSGYHQGKYAVPLCCVYTYLPATFDNIYEIKVLFLVGYFFSSVGWQKQVHRPASRLH